MRDFVAKGGLRLCGTTVETVEVSSSMTAGAAREGMAVDDKDASSEG